MSECGNCEVHRFIACKNGVLPGGCQRSQISPLFSAEPERASRHDSLASSGEFTGGAGKRAGNPYEDAVKRIQDLQKKIQDLRDQEEIDDMKALVDAGDEYFKLEAEVNQFIKLKSTLARLKEQLKPRSVRDEMICAWRQREKSHLAQLLEKQLEIWDERGLYC
jgi:hypothetical protein